MATVESIAPMIGCAPQTLHDWVRQHEIERGMRDGVTQEERDRIKALEREVKELRRANEILKLSSAFFAQAELDRRCKHGQGCNGHPCLMRMLVISSFWDGHIAEPINPPYPLVRREIWKVRDRIHRLPSSVYLWEVAQIDVW